MTSKNAEETCSGYLRKPHNATPILYLLYPDGKKHGLCRVCANRWLLSDEEWGNTELPKPYFGPFPQPPNEDKEPISGKSQSTH